MENELACILPEGWDTQLKELNLSLLPGSTLTSLEFGPKTLQWLKGFALQFARYISLSGDADFKQVSVKSISSSLLSCIKEPFTRKQFLIFCKDVVKGLLRHSENYTEIVKQYLLLVLKKTLSGVCAVAICPDIKDFFNKVLEAAEELSHASKSGVQALKVGAAVDGVVWAFSVGYTYHRYRNNQIDKPTAQRTVIKRSGAAVGSIGLGAAGAFIGTLVFPGVGTFVGGFIGGLAGDYLGSQAGEKVAEHAIQEQEHHDRQD